MSDQKLLCNNFQNDFLGTKYARSNYQGGGVCIYIRADVDFATTDLSKYYDEKNIEICSLKIFLAKTNILILCIYRSPHGNFEYFINKLDKVLKLLSKTKNEYILCGYFNVNFLEESPRKSQLLILLQSYNLYPTVQFPTRITDTTISTVDNIFIDKARINSHEVFAIGNGLSNHDAQCLVITIKLLDFVHRPDFYKQKTQRFGNWICFRLQALHA
jgi:hypothetical protein